MQIETFFQTLTQIIVDFAQWFSGLNITIFGVHLTLPLLVLSGIVVSLLEFLIWGSNDDN